MNIFALSDNPRQAAQYHADKHVIKMILETAQMLCCPFAGEAPYKATHKKHPCTLWAVESRENYLWLIELGRELHEEYKFRYGRDREHASAKVIEWCYEHIDDLNLGQSGRTPFAQAMPDEYKSSNPIESYRQYYLGEKQKLLQWTKREAPDWVSCMV